MKNNVLVVDDEESIRWVLGTSLEKSGYTVDYGENGSEALSKASSNDYSLILLDINMPDLDGFEVLNKLKEAGTESPIILITAQNTVSNAIESIQMGAYDYIAKPFDLDEVDKIVEKAIESYKSTKKVGRGIKSIKDESISLDEIVGSSGEMLDIYKTIGRVADKDITVLVTGESGTGKELIAKAIHGNSLRKRGKIVSVNISAIPKELIEAARVDGLSWFGVFWRICLPLSVPVTLGAGLLLFVFQWESYLWPLIAAPSPELHLIQVTLGRFSTEYEMVWNQQFAASSIAGFLPLVFIYMFQKQFVSALTGVEQK